MRRCCARAAEQDRPEVAAHRRRWRVWQRYMDPEAFVFLDETGATTTMARRYGWSPRGERPVDAAPHGRWKTTTFLAGLRSTGITAPLVLDGPMTGEAFLAYVPPVPRARAQARRRRGDGQPRRPHGRRCRQAIRAVGASILCLPPCSPDLNPIEQVLAKLKALLRKAAARTREALRTTIGTLLDAFNPAECRNYLQNSGYAFD